MALTSNMSSEYGFSMFGTPLNLRDMITSMSNFFAPFRMLGLWLLAIVIVIILAVVLLLKLIRWIKQKVTE